jgi:hypothetical protein
MFGKKKETQAIKLPPPAPESRQIKENIGNVSNAGMMDVGASPEPPLPPRVRTVPETQQPLPPPPLPASRVPVPKQAQQLPFEPRIEPARVASSNRPSPPLFIKIDKYRELVQNIKELRSGALSLRDALDALTDIEKELRNGINITQNALDRFNTIMTAIDSKLLKVGAEEDVIEVPKDMDDYVKQLYDHVERIKHDLKTIKED